MFDHPVSIAGYILIVLAFGLALVGFGTTDQEFARGANYLLGANAFEYLGFFLVLLGVIARGFERVEAAVVGRGRSGKPATTNAKRERVVDEVEQVATGELDEAELVRRQLMERGFKA